MKKRILVVDDDPGISDVVKIILQEGGYHADVLSDGIDIADKIKVLKPDLILLDIWMSGCDGRDIIKTLRNDSSTNKIPIVIMSALSNTGTIAAESGADDYLAKPFDMNNLLAKVKKYAN